MTEGTPQPAPPSPSTRSITWARVARRIRVPLSFLAGAAYIWLAQPTRYSLIIGMLAILPGLLLRGIASGYVQKDKELTTGGPYGYTRNPLYLGSLIMAAGFAIAARNWWVVALIVIMFTVIYVPVIAGEERYLRQTFPEYDDYAQRVPRMLPRVTPYGNQKGIYSSERFWKHREYQASLGCMMILAILIAKLAISSR